MAVQNGVMMQFFHWYTPDDGKLWNQLTESAQSLSEAGISALWLPPAYKGANGGYDTGYGVYDLFDLGEFDQKGTVRTKYGTRDEYLKAIKTAQASGIQVYADIVFNHKMGGDEEEKFLATPFNANNHREPLGKSRKLWLGRISPFRAERGNTPNCSGIGGIFRQQIETCTIRKWRRYSFSTENHSERMTWQRAR